MPKKLPKYLNQKQVQDLIGSIYPHEIGLEAMVGLGLGAGLRIAEMSALTCSQIEIFSDGSGQVTVRDGKGGRDRVIPISPWAVDRLRPYLGGRLGGPFLMPTRGPRAHVGPMSPRAIRKALRGLFDRAELPSSYSVHTLRHTFAVGWVRAQGSEAGLQAALGHAHRSTTQVYTELAPRDVARERSRIRMEWEK